MDPTVSFEDFRTEWLGDVRQDEPSTTELGRRFAHKLITQWLDTDDASDDLVYCDGTGDGGIDVAYLHRGERGDAGNGEGEAPAEGDIWYLVQSKYGSAFRGTVTLLAEGQKVVESLDGKRRLSSLAEGLLERLTQFRRSASDLDRIILVFATEDPLTDDEKRALNDVRAVGRERLGPMFDVEAVSIATIYQRTLEEPAAILPRLQIPLRATLAASGGGLLVGSTSLLALYEFLKKYREEKGDLDELYEKNVRQFLGTRGKINKAMRQTLLQSPDRFGLYNNGITIVVTDFEQGTEGRFILVEPYVVNGCQTTRTIWEVCHARLEAGGTGKDPHLEEWRRKAEEGVVVTKVVKVGVAGEDLLQAITRYTNSQNAIREKDFLALSSDFRTWAREMANAHNVFLEIQRGGWESRRALQKQNPKIPQFNAAANAFDLLKVYGAGWLGEAGTAFGRNAAFLPNGTIFRRIVKSDGAAEPFGLEDLYAAYRLQEATGKYEFGRAAKRLSRRQTRFLFFMVVIDLLRDVLLRAGMPNTPKAITRALVKLFDSSDPTAIAALLDAAIDVVDEYLTQGTEDSVFGEPSFQNVFNSNLNSYLKWEQMGKTEEASPRFRSLIQGSRRTLGRSVAGQPSPRDVITSAIK